MPKMFLRVANRSMLKKFKSEIRKVTEMSGKTTYYVVLPGIWEIDLGKEFEVILNDISTQLVPIEGARRGRPTKKIDWKEFDNLINKGFDLVHCSRSMDIPYSTLYRKVKDRGEVVEPESVSESIPGSISKSKVDLESYHCGYMKKNGTPCRNAKMLGVDYCYVHSDDKVCAGKTMAGKPCMRKPASGEIYCPWHRQPESKALESEIEPTPELEVDDDDDELKTGFKEYPCPVKECYRATVPFDSFDLLEGHVRRQHTNFKVTIKQV